MLFVIISYSMTKVSSTDFLIKQVTLCYFPDQQLSFSSKLKLMILLHFAMHLTKLRRESSCHKHVVLCQSLSSMSPTTNTSVWEIRLTEGPLGIGDFIRLYLVVPNTSHRGSWGISRVLNIYSPCSWMLKRSVSSMMQFPCPACPKSIHLWCYCLWNQCISCIPCGCRLYVFSNLCSL